MSILSKKFKALLEASEENNALKRRVTALEDQVDKMHGALGHVMKSYVDLAKMTVDHRQGLEEVYAYLTASELDESDALSDEPEPTPEELAERKRMMN